MLNMDEQKQLRDSSSNGSASGQEEDAECAKTIKRRLFGSKRKIAILAAVCLVIAATIFSLGILVGLNYQKDVVKCPSVTCPPDWIAHQELCYYLSKEEKNWMESRNFCILHNASLAKITKEEMDFVTNLTRDHVFWIGLKREPPQPWKWLDGENSTLAVGGDGANCAYLVDTTANSGTCINKHRYICKKNDFMKQHDHHFYTVV
ncbi:C-type lectin domain family 2 member B-like [Thamnophis elegans]|uniref:C-type lectin domain family 2 member B-like n=1 Tax=Thamnophis elegans TaxID=35005 RepID=UPI0013780B50|nr:C-type lectin domain family 2 member B-like [Thamnophis elegans]XP_032067674.1 C-type lectin domain family 2 member B-like [Thamnophis elegans]XP_032067675.1 C-type lectin domain family 2 member B-like [Thamnophis elegans]XP_032067676.1 C-type lectin domain family 2 member B-like [Thamnophis elegans]